MMSILNMLNCLPYSIGEFLDLERKRERERERERELLHTYLREWCNNKQWLLTIIQNAVTRILQRNESPQVLV